MTDEILRSALYGAHVAGGATMGRECGWEVPMSYRGAQTEAAEVRRHAGVFDLSHLGRIRIRGDESLDLVESLCTTDVIHQEDDTARYTLLLNESGGVVADAVIVRLEDFWLITTDACNRLKVLTHAREIAEGLEVKVDDQTPKTAMLGICGAGAMEVLDAVLPQKPGDLPAGGVRMGSLMIARYIAMRTGYTGLWGLEVILPKMFVGKAWRFITEKVGDKCLAPAGMAARDVLRIEAGRPRYGHELDETIDPVTAELAWAVDFGHEFIGRRALEEIRQAAPTRKRIGLGLTATAGRQQPGAIPARGAAVSLPDGGEVGAVTSATFSPALDKVVAMACVATEAAEVGASLGVAAGGPGPRGGQVAAEIMELPFVRTGPK